MQVFKNIPFHAFQDHCCERRFKYLGVPNYYEVACSLAGVDQCNPRICPVWNAPAALPVSSGGNLPLHQQNRPQQQPQGPYPRPQGHDQQPRPVSPAPAPGHPRAAVAPVAQPPIDARAPRHAPSPGPVQNDPPAGFSTADPDDTPDTGAANSEPAAVEVGGSLREINLKLKEEAHLAQKDAPRRRPSRRRGGSR